MKFHAMASAVVLFLESTATFAQNSKTSQGASTNEGEQASQANPLSTFNRFGYSGLKTTLVASAETMPEENYNYFKPTEAVRSYGQIVGPLADAQDTYCSTALGENNPGLKIEQVAAFKDALAYCDRMRANARLVTAPWLDLNVPLKFIFSAFSLPGQSVQHPKKLLLSHILIKVSFDAGQGGTDEVNLARKRAEDVLRAARSGTSFAHLAEQYSEDPATAELGGSLGWVRRGQLAPALDEAAFQLKVGEISGIVQSAFGFHILRLVATADDHESAFPAAPRFHKLPVAPPEASPEQSRASVSRWPDPNNPRQMAVGKTISELRELCSQNSGSPLGDGGNSRARSYDCALVAISMDPDYENLVDRIAALQKQVCRLYNGSLPERAPADPELARVWKEVQLLAKEWGKRSATLLDDAARAEAAEANTEAENSGLVARRQAQRLVLDFWRVNSNCGNGL